MGNEDQEPKIPNSEKIKYFYYQVTDLWKRFCEEHATLFNLTCEEYSNLLKTDLEKLEKTIAEKDTIINRINALEKLRFDLISEINSELVKNQDLRNIFNIKKIDAVSDLLELMNNYEKKLDEKYLNNFNSLLIDIIQKIQKQNKKNQIFINKAIISLKEIKGSVDGGKNFNTYTQEGLTTNKVNQIKFNSKEEPGRIVVKPS